MELVDMNSLGLFDLKILSVQVGFTLLTHSKLNTFFYWLVPAPAPVPVLIPKSVFFIILLYLVYGCYYHLFILLLFFVIIKYYFYIDLFIYSY